MHFVFASSGSFGDVAPLIVMALELQERGHECVFVANPFHRKAIENWGLRCEPVGDAASYLAGMSDPRLDRPRHCIHGLIDQAVAELPAMYRGIERVAKPDSVVVYRVLSAAARVAEEKLGLKGCGVSLSPMELGCVEHPPAVGRPMVNRLIRALPLSMRRDGAERIEKWALGPKFIPAVQKLRADVGLPPIEGSIRKNFRQAAALMMAFPDWFADRESQWPDHMRFQGFMFLPETGELDPAVGAFLDDGPPPVVVSAGSAIRIEDGFAERMTTAARSLGKRVLVLSFTQRGGASVEGDVCTTRPVPVHMVLPRAAAVAHRGGIGFVAQCLRFGVPQLLMGHVMDQPDNGERVEKRLGAGRWCFGPGTSASALARAMDEVVDSPGIRAGAQAAAARMKPDLWRSEAADRLESLRI